jgi:hypothetical protein
MPNKWLFNFVAYLVLSLLLYHSFQTFRFINISPFEKQVFMLKAQVALNELEPNSTNIMRSLIIDKYMNHCHS